MQVVTQGALNWAAADLTEDDELDPKAPRPHPDARSRRVFMQKVYRELNGDEAALIIGHQPALGWLCNDLTQAPRLARMVHWHAGPVPIDSSEVVCLSLRSTNSDRWPRGDVLWTIHPGDKKAADDIREKIKSKMETAKLLAGVITLVLTALLGILLDQNKWTGLQGCPSGRPASTQGCLSITPFGFDTLTLSGQHGIQIVFGLLIAALALYLMTMYAYDSLLMPPRFWARPRRVAETRGTTASNSLGCRADGRGSRVGRQASGLGALPEHDAYLVHPLHPRHASCRDRPNPSGSHSPAPVCGRLLAVRRHLAGAGSLPAADSTCHWQRRLTSTPTHLETPTHSLPGREFRNLLFSNP